MTILVTGGAGFIGTNFVLDWIHEKREKVINLDLLTYAGNIHNLKTLKGCSQHQFVQGNICDQELVAALLCDHRPRAIIHIAAETHVDRAIEEPKEFVYTNIVGTYCLLSAALTYWRGLSDTERRDFRFLHVSTDEVHGSLGPDDPPFRETTPYAPNNPYSASKASSDHLVRAYCRTYDLPTLTTNCSNNYGPYQFPEKLIPLIIHNAIAGKMLPVYGNGLFIRDWLYVKDHCAAIRQVLDKGRIGETYNIGGSSERSNIEVVTTICRLIDELRPQSSLTPHSHLINFVTDRPGHDRRYAIDACKIERELGWRPKESFENGLRCTLQWYLDNQSWTETVMGDTEPQLFDAKHGQRKIAS